MDKMECECGTRGCKLHEQKPAHQWCEHCDIKIGKDGVYQNQAYSYGWQFCPFCGTPRPAEKPKLWEIFMEIKKKETGMNFHDHVHERIAKSQAEAALDTVLEIMDSISCLNEKFKIKDADYWKGEIKHRLEALRGAE